MKFEPLVYWAQIGLKSKGFDSGKADGLRGKKTDAALLRAEISRGTLSNESESRAPLPTYRDKTQYFGRHGDESALKRVKLPWEMKIVGMRHTRKTVRMHELIADKFICALEDIKRTIGMKGVKKYGLDLFGGDYVNRSSRANSRSISDHAWGAAIDLNPEANGLWEDWKPSKAMPNNTFQIPKRVVKIFQKHGFQVGFKTKIGRRDMMHIAYINRR